MSWVAVVVGVAVVGSAIYGSEQQRKAAHQSADALKKAEDEDARNAAEAETNAAVAANAALAADKRRRRVSSLSGSGDQTALGAIGGATMLGGQAVSRGAASNSSAYSGTALGAGAPATSVAYRPVGGGGNTQRNQAKV